VKPKKEVQDCCQEDETRRLVAEFSGGEIPEPGEGAKLLPEETIEIMIRRRRSNIREGKRCAKS